MRAGDFTDMLSRHSESPNRALVFSLLAALLCGLSACTVYSNQDRDVFNRSASVQSAGIAPSIQSCVPTDKASADPTSDDAETPRCP